MLNLVKPRYVMPVHGDFKRLRLHGQLADTPPSFTRPPKRRSGMWGFL